MQFVKYESRRPSSPPEVGVEAWLLFQRMERHRPESLRTNSKGIARHGDHHSNQGPSNQQPHPPPSTNNDGSDHLYQSYEIPASRLSSEHQDLQGHRSHINNISGSKAVNRNDSNIGNQHGGQFDGSE